MLKNILKKQKLSRRLLLKKIINSKPLGNVSYNNIHYFCSLETIDDIVSLLNAQRAKDIVVLSNLSSHILSLVGSSISMSYLLMFR